MSENIFLKNNENSKKNILLLNVKNDLTFKKQLLLGSNVNTKFENGWCLLFELIYTKTQHKIKDIMAHGANINIRDNTGKNALYWAVYYKNIEAIEILINLNIELLVDINTNLHVMHYCVFKSNVKIFKKLIKLGLDVNQKDFAFCSVYTYALLYNRVRILDYLNQNFKDEIIK